MPLRIVAAAAATGWSLLPFSPKNSKTYQVLVFEVDFFPSIFVLAICLLGDKPARSSPLCLPLCSCIGPEVFPFLRSVPSCRKRDTLPRPDSNPRLTTLVLVRTPVSMQPMRDNVCTTHNSLRSSSLLKTNAAVDGLCFLFGYAFRARLALPRETLRTRPRRPRNVAS